MRIASKISDYVQSFGSKIAHIRVELEQEEVIKAEKIVVDEGALKIFVVSDLFKDHEKEPIVNTTFTSC